MMFEIIIARSFFNKNKNKKKENGTFQAFIRPQIRTRQVFSVQNVLHLCLLVQSLTGLVGAFNLRLVFYPINKKIDQLVAKFHCEKSDSFFKRALQQGEDVHFVLLSSASCRRQQS